LGDVDNRTATTLTFTTDADDHDLLANTAATGNLILIGDGNVNTLRGGGGADVLDGGTGSDYLTGGGGADQFRFDAAAAFGDDVVQDFQDGIDILNLDGLNPNYSIQIQNSGADALVRVLDGANAFAQISTITVVGQAGNITFSDLLLT
ncbi:hypothetical protein DKG74_21030, partial [Zavarzinia aquatilis]